jgi:lipopolysaccharide export system protein LptA
LALAGTLALAPVVAPASAQDKATAKPAASAASSFSMGDMLGSGNTNVAFDGSFEIERDQNTGEVLNLKVTKGVHVRSDQMNLDCDLLIYDKQSGHMVATGEIDRPVHLKKDDVIATCQKLEAYPDEGKSVLTGKPVVKQGGANAGEMRGSKVTLIQKEGKMRVLVDGGGPGGGNVSTSGTSPAPGSNTGGGAEMLVPLSKMNGASATPKATPAATPKASSDPVLLNPKPAAGAGHKAPSVAGNN